MDTCYWKVKPDIQKETHQRHALIDLASDINTPKDILDSDFGEPQLKFRQTVAMDAHVELDYFVSLGYEKTVKRQVWNKRWHEYEDRYETETEWRPHSGNYSCNVSCICDNTSDPKKSKELRDVYSSLVKEDYYSPDKANFDSPEPTPPCEEAVSFVKDLCIQEAKRKCKNSFGRETSNFSANTRTTPTALHSVTIPYYEMAYTHKEKNYVHEMFTAGNHRVSGTAPDESQKNKELIDKMGMPMFIASIALTTISLIMTNWFISMWIPLIFVFLATCAITCDVLLMERIVSSQYNISLKAKKTSLSELLKKLNLAALTEAEEKLFQFKNRKKDVRISQKQIFLIAYYVGSYIVFSLRFHFMFLFLGILAAIAIFLVKKNKNKSKNNED